MLIDTLQQYGFSEKEAKVYLASLSLGTAPWSTIARHANENRLTVYSILKSLVEDGIFSLHEKWWIKYFSPISPELLLRNLEDKYNNLKNKIPELMALMDKVGNKPKVQFFEWLEGMKNMYDDMLTYPWYEIYSFLGTKVLDNQFKDYLDNIFVPKRVEKNIEAKVICDVTEQNNEYKQTHKEALLEVKFVENSSFFLSSWIDIYGEDKILLSSFSHDEMSGIIITSKQLHNTFKSIFSLVWESH